MRQILLLISFAVVGLGIYFMYFYDVPDAQATINFFTSWFFIIVGISSLLVNIFWSGQKKDKSPEE